MQKTEGNFFRALNKGGTPKFNSNNLSKLNKRQTIGERETHFHLQHNFCHPNITFYFIPMGSRLPSGLASLYPSPGPGGLRLKSW